MSLRKFTNFHQNPTWHIGSIKKTPPSCTNGWAFFILLYILLFFYSIDNFMSLWDVLNIYVQGIHKESFRKLPLNLCKTKSQGNIWVLNIIEILLAISSIFESTSKYLIIAKVLKIQEYDYLGYSSEIILFSLNLKFCFQ